MTKPVHVSFDDATLAKLDGWAAANGIRTRSAAIRALVEGKMAEELSGRDEAVEMLTESARAGSVTARVALVRHYGPATPDEHVARRMDELARRRRERMREPGVG
jgi:metal-responsive CopG/Arc/MetJ family transcriptional regulator